MRCLRQGAGLRPLLCRRGSTPVLDLHRLRCPHTLGKQTRRKTLSLLSPVTKTCPWCRN
ncbi:hypothetical protein KSP39_PZI006877 [Platanthera zijinensis]|uniref:Uncharacterized protein n=1 Tax=Platanthera zijinensis TaxID=2320716 RepID=A0AAP0BQN2_9ASPA